MFVHFLVFLAIQVQREREKNSSGRRQSSRWCHFLQTCCPAM